MSDKIVIRHATASDLDTLASIEAASYPPEEGASRSSIQGRLDVYPEYFWLCDEDGTVSSFVNGFVTDEPDLTDEMYDTPAMHNPNGAWQMIFSVVTAPEYRHSGRASMVLKQVICDAKAQGRKGVVLTCKDRLLPFYSQFGFVNEGVSNSVHGGAVWYQMRLTF